MTELIKTYNFAGSIEEWVATVGDPDWVDALYYARVQLHPEATLGGSLRMTVKGNCLNPTENYWELTKTWLQLGIPVGMIVTTVKLDYRYRWQCKGTRGANVEKANNSLIQFAEGDAASGPAEFRDADGVLLNTFSSRIDCIARGEDQWVGYPDGSANADVNNWYEGDPQVYRTEYPLTATPISWGDASGSILNVPSAQQPSATTVKFRIRNLLPATGDPSGGPPYNSRNWLRYKIDRIVITMEYSVTPSGLIKTKVMFVYG